MAAVNLFSTSPTVKLPLTNIVVLGSLPILPFASQIAGTASLNNLQRLSDHSLTSN